MELDFAIAIVGIAVVTDFIHCISYSIPFYVHNIALPALKKTIDSAHQY